MHAGLVPINCRVPYPTHFGGARYCPEAPYVFAPVFVGFVGRFRSTAAKPVHRREQCQSIASNRPRHVVPRGALRPVLRPRRGALFLTFWPSGKGRFRNRESAEDPPPVPAVSGVNARSGSVKTGRRWLAAARVLQQGGNLLPYAKVADFSASVSAVAAYHRRRASMTDRRVCAPMGWTGRRDAIPRAEGRKSKRFAHVSGLLSR
jgi:hypothetical protein